MPSIIEKFKSNFKTVIFISSCVIVLGIIFCFVPYVGWPVGLPLISLAMLVGGGAILARGSETILLHSPLRPNLTSETNMQYSSADGTQSTQLNGNQRQRLISELQTGLLPEQRLRGIIGHLSNDNNGRETKIEVLQALQTQMNLLFKNCTSSQNALELASCIECLLLLSNAIRREDYKFIPQLLRSWARDVCESIDRLVRSQEYCQTMPNIKEVNEQSVLLEAGGKITKAIQSLLASDVFGNMGTQIRDFPIEQGKTASNPGTDELKISLGP